MIEEINVGCTYMGDDSEIVTVTSLYIDSNRVFFKIIKDPNGVWDSLESELDWWFISAFKERFDILSKAYKSPLWRALND
jgi:hypothetical protein